MEQTERTLNRKMNRDVGLAASQSQQLSSFRETGHPAALPTLEIILVNRNSGDLLLTALRAVDAARVGDFCLQSVTVVDDDSTDGSANIPALESLPLRVIRNGKRLGYGS